MIYNDLFKALGGLCTGSSALVAYRRHLRYVALYLFELPNLCTTRRDHVGNKPPPRDSNRVQTLDEKSVFVPEARLVPLRKEPLPDVVKDEPEPLVQCGRVRRRSR